EIAVRSQGLEGRANRGLQRLLGIGQRIDGSGPIARLERAFEDLRVIGDDSLRAFRIFRIHARVTLQAGSQTAEIHATRRRERTWFSLVGGGSAREELGHEAREQRVE